MKSNIKPRKSGVRICRDCGKPDPEILQGFHASELCWCGVEKEGKDWVYRPRFNHK